MELIATIPADVIENIQSKKVIEAGFGAGPSCVAGKVQTYSLPVELGEGAAWIEKYRHVMKAAHLLLDDRTVLWFYRDGFNRYDETHLEEAVSPGVKVETAD